MTKELRKLRKEVKALEKRVASLEADREEERRMGLKTVG